MDNPITNQAEQKVIFALKDNTKTIDIGTIKYKIMGKNTDKKLPEQKQLTPSEIIAFILVFIIMVRFVFMEWNIIYSAILFFPLAFSLKGLQAFSLKHEKTGFYQYAIGQIASLLALLFCFQKPLMSLFATLFGFISLITFIVFWIISFIKLIKKFSNIKTEEAQQNEKNQNASSKLSEEATKL